MLYLLRSDGSIKVIESAVTARIDEKDNSLVCHDDEGSEVARFPAHEGRWHFGVTRLLGLH